MLNITQYLIWEKKALGAAARYELRPVKLAKRFKFIICKKGSYQVKDTAQSFYTDVNRKLIKSHWDAVWKILVKMKVHIS